MVTALRSGVQSAKAVKDIHHNLKELHDSIQSVDEEFFQVLSEHYGAVLAEIWTVSEVHHEKGPPPVSNLEHIQSNNRSAHSQVNAWIYQKSVSAGSSTLGIASYLNVDREIYQSLRYLTDAYRSLHPNFKEV